MKKSNVCYFVSKINCFIFSLNIFTKFFLQSEILISYFWEQKILTMFQ